jgi:hypothetical protein
VIGEIQLADIEPGINLADFTGRQFAAVIVIDADDDAGQRPADRAGLAQGFFSRVEGHKAGFGAAVILGDDRPPPIDHRPLDVHRARRRAVHDPHERGQIVAFAHGLGQVQQPHKHRRHDVEMRNPILLDQAQQLFRIEARLDDRERALANGMQTVEIRRRMIERSGDDGTHRFLGLKTEHLARHDPDDLDELRPEIEPLHALRIAGRAGGIDHARNAAGPGIGKRRAAGEPVVPDRRAGGSSTLIREQAIGLRDLGRRRHGQQRHAAGQRRQDLRQQIGMRDDDLGTAIAQHVADLRRLAVPVDRHAIGTAHLRRIACLEEREVVAQHQRDRPARRRARQTRPRRAARGRAASRARFRARR